MDKQKEIEKMAFSICPMPQAAEYITDCTKCGYNGDCLRQKYAKKFMEKGYGDVRAAVKEFADKFKMRFFFIMATNMKSPIYQCTGDEIDRLVKEVCGNGD